MASGDCANAGDVHNANQTASTSAVDTRGVIARTCSGCVAVCRTHVPGFRGTACVETFGHGALMAVTHMLPRILLLPGDD